MLRASILILLSLAGLASPAAAQPDRARRWLAGDHHVHSIYSARYREDAAHPDMLPEPEIGGDGIHTILQNAQMARRFGLDWMVSTDHGGPAHSALNHDRAWPDVVAARAAVPGLTLFYGWEFDVPGGEHASLILPTGPGERDMLRDIESRFGKREAFPPDPARSTKARMIEALRYMGALPVPPVLIANHPSRTATGFGRWGLHAPAEYIRWHDAAPRVAIGMEGAPGHQAATPEHAEDAAHGMRGLYGGYPTMGGFDQMVATLGGAWDAMLGQGVRWTITATSDSHRHRSEGGADFWPGEYAKTWVFAAPDPADILDGLRAGRVFAATGGLIEELDFSARAAGGTAGMGGELKAEKGQTLAVTIRFRPASRPNPAGVVPRVDHVDLIVGGATSGAGDRNPTTRLVRRFTARDWRREGDMMVIRYRLPAPGNGYLRLRGTSTREGEPAPDFADEDPWQDLWFYGNPIYLKD
ncbi:CehA/McbA family metallohydrolase domain-containing protein [Sphingomonas sp. RS6]